jgi:hypothetical protein
MSTESPQSALTRLETFADSSQNAALPVATQRARQFTLSTGALPRIASRGKPKRIA